MYRIKKEKIITVLEIEKKAEEYTKECEVPTLVGMIGRKCDKVKRAYKDGYEQGQEQMYSESFKEYQKLKKENEELKTQIEKINELNVNLQNRFLRLMKFKIENEKLKSQIERIKTCKVCENKKCENSHSNVEYIWHKEGDFICDNRDKWELAE